MRPSPSRSPAGSALARPAAGRGAAPAGPSRRRGTPWTAGHGRAALSAAGSPGAGGECFIHALSRALGLATAVAHTTCREAREWHGGAGAVGCWRPPGPMQSPSPSLAVGRGAHSPARQRRRELSGVVACAVQGLLTAASRWPSLCLCKSRRLGLLVYCRSQELSLFQNRASSYTVSVTVGKTLVLFYPRV